MRDNMYSINISAEAVVKLLKVAKKNKLTVEKKKKKKDTLDDVTLLENSYPVSVIVDNHRNIISIQMKTSIKEYSKVYEAGEIKSNGLICSDSIKDI